MIAHTTRRTRASGFVAASLGGFLVLPAAVAAFDARIDDLEVDTCLTRALPNQTMQQHVLVQVHDRTGSVSELRGSVLAALRGRWPPRAVTLHRAGGAVRGCARQTVRLAHARLCTQVRGCRAPRAECVHDNGDPDATYQLDNQARLSVGANPIAPRCRGHRVRQRTEIAARRSRRRRSRRPFGSPERRWQDLDFGCAAGLHRQLGPGCGLRLRTRYERLVRAGKAPTRGLERHRISLAKRST